MSGPIIDTVLDEKVEELSAKATRIERSKDTKSKVVGAANDIGRINDRIDEVQQDAEELRFYVRVYENAFNETRPETVQPAIRDALANLEIDDTEVLSAARDERLSEIEDQVETADARIGEAISALKEALKVIQGDWEADLESAKELNKIIGGDSEFQSLIREIRGFLGSEMWNTTKDPSQLSARWQRYEGKWEENTGKHGWETFQTEHNLDDNTVRDLKQFAEGDPVRLSDLSLGTLEEIKRVPDLERALQLEIRS